MGSRGPMPKPASQRHGHRKKPDTTTTTASRRTPTPSVDWLEPTLEAWTTYWASDLSRMTIAVDLPSIRRLFGLYDQHERSMEVVRRALMVKGSTGQIRTNPLADHVLKLEGVILRLENELGLTPMARTRLGIALPKPVAAEAPAPQDGPYAGLRVLAS